MTEILGTDPELKRRLLKANSYIVDAMSFMRDGGKTVMGRAVKDPYLVASERLRGALSLCYEDTVPQVGVRAFAEETWGDISISAPIENPQEVAITHWNVALDLQASLGNSKDILRLTMKIRDIRSPGDLGLEAPGQRECLSEYYFNNPPRDKEIPYSITDDSGKQKICGKCDGGVLCFLAPPYFSKPDFMRAIVSHPRTCDVVKTEDGLSSRERYFK